jgi:hypothetical protein
MVDAMPISGMRAFRAAVLVALAALACAPPPSWAASDDPAPAEATRPAVPAAAEPFATGDVLPPGPDGARGPGADAPRAVEEGVAASRELALTPPATRGDFPWASLGSADYWLVREVVDRAAVSRQVNDIAFRSRKPVFDFLIAHLDFASDVARALRQGKYRVRRAGDDAYEAEDGYGARGILRTVVAEGDRRVFYLAGSYDAPLLPALEVRGVVHVDADHVDGVDGVTYCELHVAGHLRFDSRLASTLVTVARQYGEAQLGRGLHRFFRHVAVISRRAYDDPEGLADELSSRPDLAPERVAQFREILLAGRPPAWSETQRFELVEPLAPAVPPAPAAPGR